MVGASGHSGRDLHKLGLDSKSATASLCAQVASLHERAACLCLPQYSFNRSAQAKLLVADDLFLKL